MTLTQIQLVLESNTLKIAIAFPFNGEIHVVSHVCLISQMRSPSAMRAPRETPHRSMKDTCPTPRLGTCVFASRSSKNQVS